MLREIEDIGDDYINMKTDQKVQISYIDRDFTFDLCHEHDILYGVDRILMLFYNEEEAAHKTYAFHDKNISIADCIRVINKKFSYAMDINKFLVTMKEGEYNDIINTRVRDIELMQADISS
jgi:hypothetical protein